MVLVGELVGRNIYNASPPPFPSTHLPPLLGCPVASNEVSVLILAYWGPRVGILLCIA